MGGATGLRVTFLVTEGDIAYTPREMETIRQLENLWGYASRCAAMPASEPACASFWTAIDIAVVAVFMLAALYLVRRMANHLLAVRANKMHVDDKMRVADPATMDQYKADTDKLLEVPHGENVEERIRQALEERQAKEWLNPGTPDGATKP